MLPNSDTPLQQESSELQQEELPLPQLEESLLPPLDTPLQLEPGLHQLDTEDEDSQLDLTLPEEELPVLEESGQDKSNKLKKKPKLKNNNKRNKRLKLKLKSKRNNCIVCIVFKRRRDF